MPYRFCLTPSKCYTASHSEQVLYCSITLNKCYTVHHSVEQVQYRYCFSLRASAMRCNCCRNLHTQCAWPATYRFCGDALLGMPLMTSSWFVTFQFCGCGVGASVAGVFSWHAIRADFPTPQWCLVSPVGLIAGALCWMRLCGCYTPGLPELIRRISWVVRRRAVVSVPTSPSSHLWRS